MATMESTATPTHELFFHHDDHLGGANIVTDSTATVTQVIDYYPFGTPRVDVQSASYDSTQKFTGHELDASTELYYAKARYYNSEIGRFVSQDPLQYRPAILTKNYLIWPQVFNFYSYSLNSPILFHDPTGEVPDPTDAVVSVCGPFALVCGVAKEAIENWILSGLAVAVGGYVGHEAGQELASLSDGDAASQEDISSAEVQSASSSTGMPDPDLDPEESDSLTDAQRAAVNRVKEIQHNFNARSTLSGDPNFLDVGHIKKIQDGVRGLENSIQSLQGSLNNPNLTNNARNILQKSLDVAEDLVRESKKILDSINISP